MDDLLVYEKSHSVDQINQLLRERKIKGIRIFCPFEEDCLALKDFGFLSEIEGLKELSFFHSMPIKFDFLYGIKDLQVLSVQTLFSEIDFSKLPRLKELSIHFNEKFIANVDFLDSLKALNVSFDRKTKVYPFDTLRSLKKLSIRGCNAASLELISCLVHLEALLIGDFRSLVGLEGIGDLHRLKYLELNGCAKLKDIEELSALSNLEVMEIIDCKNTSSNYGFVANLKSLTQLSLLGKTKSDGINIENIAGIENVFLKGYTRHNRERMSFFNYSV